MYFTTDGVVLRETAYRDADKLLTVLTSDRGQLTLRARGVRSRQSKWKPSCQLLAYSEFTVFENRGKMTVDEAEPKRLFASLRTDLELLALASYFAQVAELLSQEDSPGPQLLRLLLQSFHALEGTDRPQALVKAVFELRAACLAGFMPDLSGCAACGRENPEYFNVSDGQLLCEGCDNGSDGLRMPVSPGTLAAMRHIAGGERPFSFRLGAESLRALSGLAETYLAMQLERGFSTLDFYKSLIQDKGAAI